MERVVHTERHHRVACDMVRFLSGASGIITINSQVDIIRAILHDPETYPDPEEFRPERYMKDGKIDPEAKDPAIAAFGYGRR